MKNKDLIKMLRRFNRLAEVKIINESAIQLTAQQNHLGEWTIKLEPTKSNESPINENNLQEVEKKSC